MNIRRSRTGEEVRFPMACRAVPDAERRLLDWIGRAYRLGRVEMALDAVRELAVLRRFRDRHCLPPKGAVRYRAIRR